MAIFEFNRISQILFIRSIEMEIALSECVPRSDQYYHLQGLYLREKNS